MRRSKISIRRSSRPAFVHRVTFFLADSRHGTRIGDEQQEEPLKAPRVRADTVTAESMDAELR